MLNYEDPRKTEQGFEYRLSVGNVLRLSQAYGRIQITVTQPYATKVETSFDGYKWHTLLTTNTQQYQQAYYLSPSTLYIRLARGGEIAFTLHNPSRQVDSTDATGIRLIDLDSFVHKDEMERLKVEVKNLKKFVAYKEE